MHAWHGRPGGARCPACGGQPRQACGPAALKSRCRRTCGGGPGGVRGGEAVLRQRHVQRLALQRLGPEPRREPLHVRPVGHQARKVPQQPLAVHARGGRALVQQRCVEGGGGAVSMGVPAGRGWVGGWCCACASASAQQAPPWQNAGSARGRTSWSSSGASAAGPLLRGQGLQPAAAIPHLPPPGRGAPAAPSCPAARHARWGCRR
jgi:hypothetical protein